MSLNWNDAAENAIAGGLGLVPDVGSLLSVLVYIFWPSSGEDVWSEIKDEVEALIEQDIDHLVYQQVQQSLAGLQNNLNDYLTAVADKDNISATWITTDGDFDQQLPSFQASGYQLLLLPLFAQFANLNLALLRDGVQFGESWGWNAAYQKSVLAKLQDKISDFTTYVNRIYQSGYQSVVGNTREDDHACQPFRSVNAYVREMTLTVQDFVEMWPYFDPSKYPNPVAVYLDREIYSDPVGTCDDSGAINLPSPPTQPISQISVWAWDRIDGVQLTYPTGGGPGGVTTTARMGDQDGGSNQHPHGGVFNVSANPVTVAGGASGDILNAFDFTFKDGSSTGQLGGNYSGGSPFSFSYAGQILSSIHINGVSDYYGSADCAVFGFKYEQSQTAILDALRLQYVASPSGTSLEALAQRSVAVPVALEQLTAHALAQGWEEERQAYYLLRRHD